MIGSFFEKIGGLFKKKSVSRVRLDVIAEQVEEFNQARSQMDDKIHNLEDKTELLDEAVSKTLEITNENQKRLFAIEENLNRIIDISEKIVKEKTMNHQKEKDNHQAGDEKTQEEAA